MSLNLTSMQEKAALEFYKTKSWERAARAAGYRSTSAASDLRCNSSIRARVKQLEENDSLKEFVTIPHCTDLLIRAALGQAVEVDVGQTRQAVKFGSKSREQLFFDAKGNLTGSSITFEHDPLRALELLIKLCGWSAQEQVQEKPGEDPERYRRILEAVQKVCAKRVR